jgi:hypothetical protein
MNSGDADTTLAFMATLSAVMYYVWWKERRRWQWLLAAVFGAFCIMAKKEGLIFFMAASTANVAMALCGEKGIRRRLLGVCFAAAGATLLIAMPWFLTAARLPSFYTEDYTKSLNRETLGAVHQRGPAIAWYIKREFLNFTKWNIIWIAYILVLPVAIASWFRKRDFFIDLVLILWLMAYVFVFFVTPLNLMFHLETALARLLLQLMPLVVIRIGLLVAPLTTELDRK